MTQSFFLYYESSLLNNINAKFCRVDCIVDQGNVPPIIDWYADFTVSFTFATQSQTFNMQQYASLYYRELNQTKNERMYT